MTHVVFILFLFAFGACVGSFLNVVVWRLPRDESLVTPPSRCPYCEHPLAWYDNIPVFGWLLLRGRCRYCHNPISAQYPAIEFLTGLLFVFYYVMFFIAHEGPCWADVQWVPDFGRMVTHYRLETIHQHWPQYVLAVIALSCLLAASLIDARHFIIPISIPILLAAIGLLYHTILDRPRVPGALNLRHVVPAAMAAGGGLGLILSNVLVRLRLLKLSFVDAIPALEIEKDPPPEDEEASWLARLVGGWIDRFRRPLTPEQRRHMQQVRSAAEARERALEAERQKQVAEQLPLKEFTRAEMRREMQREILFLIPPLLGALLAAMLVSLTPLRYRFGEVLDSYHVVSGFLGALFGALVGGLVVWITRILGSLVFGREAMGMGDVHLMFGVGAIVGAGASVVAFFLAPFCGMAVALYMFFTGKRRELPYGPYLGLATAIVMIWYCDIADYLRPGMEGVQFMLRNLLSGPPA